jgi:orotidine-5'-phosphate decarboxylase
MPENAPIFLSRKSIPPSERLIVALDVPDTDKARELVRELGESVCFYKIGLELFMAGGYFELAQWLRDQGKKIFVDLKFFDVPETVASAVRQLRHIGASFATIHGNDAMLRAGAREKHDVGILAVTALTSLDQGDMEDLGFQADIREVVLSRARRALEAGCDGVISSGLEAAELRSELGERFLIVTPGIRPGHNDSADDQKRAVNVEEAFHRGADHIVVGRPITTAADPRSEASRIQGIIQDLFSGQQD